MFLLDTCVLSETWKPRPNRGLMDWLRSVTEADLHVSVLSLGEIKRGVQRLPDGRRKLGLERDYQQLRSRFAPRVVTISALIAERWGELSADAARRGRSLHVVDGLIAASAVVSGLTVVTRNVSDFAVTPAAILNPWT